MTKLRIEWLRLVCICFCALAAILAAIYAMRGQWIVAALQLPLVCYMLTLHRRAAVWSGRIRMVRALLVSAAVYPALVQWCFGGVEQGIMSIPLMLFMPFAAALISTSRTCREWRVAFSILILLGVGIELLLLSASDAQHVAGLYGVLLVVGWMFSIGLEQVRGRTTEAIVRAQGLAVELKAAQEDLGEAGKVRSDFLASMSHEIRTPMHAISGMADMLLFSDQLGPTEYMQAENIKLASQNLLGLINDILDISKIEAGKLELYEERYDFSTMFHDVVSIISIRARENGLTFLTRVDPEIPKEMIGDSGRIRQVLLNLLGNAVKFTRQGSVTLTVQRIYQDNQLMLRFEVADTGVGISKNDMHKLYEAFEQLDATRAKNRQGTGLGLAISRKLVELMRSDLKAHSEPGKGSSFSFTVAQQVVDDAPIANVPNARTKRLLVCTDNDSFFENAVEMATRLKVKAERGLPNQSTGYTHMLLDLASEAAYAWIRLPTPPGCRRVLLIDSASTLTSFIRMSDRVIFHPLHVMTMSAVLNDALTDRGPSAIQRSRECLFPTRGVRVLLIDDNAVNLMVAANLLSLYGIQVDQATSGEQGIAMLEQTAYDIVFVDHIMPGMDGVDTVRAIRAMGGRFAKQVVLMLSANVMPESRKLFAKAGVQDMLAKPIELPKLSQLLSEYLPPEKCMNAQNATQKGFLQARLQHIEQSLAPLSLSRLAPLLASERLDPVTAYLAELQAVLQKLAPLSQLLTDAVPRITRHRRLLPLLENLRGLLVHIGEEKLCVRSKVFCLSIEEGDMPFVRENLRTFAAELEHFYDALRVALQQCDIPAAPHKSDEVPLLEQLRDLLAAYALTEAQEQLETLQASSVRIGSEQFDVLRAALNDFDYHGALTRVDTLLNGLRAEEATGDTAEQVQPAETQAVEIAPATVAPVQESSSPAVPFDEEPNDDEIPPEYTEEFDAEMAAMVAAAEGKDQQETAAAYAD